MHSASSAVRLALGLCTAAAFALPALPARAAPDDAALASPVPTRSVRATSRDVLDEIVVTAARMTEPLVVVTDPKQPRQPLPAHDGADYLKAIPGFNVIRKGGTSGDPLFRGMAASRVAMSVDGEQVLGGCGMRMDPPTAYVFPETFDRVVVVKGPQTVLHGPGNSAAVVSFERDGRTPDARGLDVHGSALVGSASRTDVVGTARFDGEHTYARLGGTRAESGDYEDGRGATVHSRYERWTGDAALGVTPDERTTLELSGARSDGEAAYADRAMDGVKFDRSNVGLRASRRDVAPHVRAIDAQAYWNYVDHVMDNYSLRAFVPTAMMPGRSASNPDRRTTGGRVHVDLEFGRVTATVGADLQRNRHTVRSTMNETMMPFEAMARTEDARFRNAGLYGEATWRPDPARKWIAGARIDDWQARDLRRTLATGMGMSMPNPTAGARRDSTLVGGFARYEHTLAGRPATAFVGVGHVERFPDYWELVSTRESTTSLSAFGTRPEKTTQLDAGLVYAAARTTVSISAFANDVSDYVLVQSNYAKGMRLVSVSRNVDARTWGGELDGRVALHPTLALTGSLAYTRGRNVTDARPLAQMPPLEARLGVEWRRGAWSAGALVRGVAAQNRVAIDQGNVVGQDIGPTGGFAVLSLNAAWAPNGTWQLTAGIDNVADRAYAEHLSRAGAMVAGYAQTTRVNEPGRVGWLKIAARY